MGPTFTPRYVNSSTQRRGVWESVRGNDKWSYVGVPPRNVDIHAMARHEACLVWVDQGRNNSIQTVGKDFCEYFCVDVKEGNRTVGRT